MTIHVESDERTVRFRLTDQPVVHDELFGGETFPTWANYIRTYDADDNGWESKLYVLGRPMTKAGHPHKRIVRIFTNEAYEASLLAEIVEAVDGGEPLKVPDTWDTAKPEPEPGTWSTLSLGSEDQP